MRKPLAQQQMVCEAVQYTLTDRHRERRM
jgi:hypothetical protein